MSCAGARVLHRLAVEPQADAEVVRVGDLVGRDERGADRGEGVERLAGHPLLARLVELPVAGRDVVADRVAADVLHRLARAGCRRPRWPMTTTSSAS